GQDVSVLAASYACRNSGLVGACVGGEPLVMVGVEACTEDADGVCEVDSLACHRGDDSVDGDVDSVDLEACFNEDAYGSVGLLGADSFAVEYRGFVVADCDEDVVGVVAFEDSFDVVRRVFTAAHAEDFACGFDELYTVEAVGDGSARTAVGVGGGLGGLALGGGVRVHGWLL